MRVSLCVVAVIVCACASGGNGGKGSSESPIMQESIERTRIETPSGPIEINWQRERTFDEAKMLVGVDKAWAAVPTAYGELGIEPGVVDSKQHVFGNAGATFRHQLGKQRLSRFFDCGATAGISNSDSYDLVVRVITQVIPAEGGLSALRTQAEATAKANAVSGQVVRCASTGALEAQIARMVGDQAARAGN